MDLEREIYLTKEGLAKLEKEYEELKVLKNQRTKNDTLTTASSLEIDSEYSAFQEDLDLLESRIAELEIILKNYKLILSPGKGSPKEVLLGTTVIVEVEGQQDEFMIVGSLEANPMLGKISNESPVGRALLGRKIGEEVKVQSSVVTIYKIRKITYNL
ncbi:MAG: GreA/GreB family elongation factor [Candidatus Parcubacteria bacterium]|nr:GreA/GreB family elongation factor [Candidatus Parcubacteria bacterium]